MTRCGVAGRGIPLNAGGGRGTGPGGLASLQMTRSLLPMADRRGGLGGEGEIRKRLANFH